MNSGRHYLGGLIGGLVGGVAFGIIMSISQNMPLIANLVGSSSILTAWLINLLISALVGLAFSWWFGNLSNTYTAGIGYGLLHGLIWWVIGGLIAMPLFLGLPILVQAFTGYGLMSLVGYLAFGVLTGIIFVAIDKPHSAYHHREHPAM